MNMVVAERVDFKELEHAWKQGLAERSNIRNQELIGCENHGVEPFILFSVPGSLKRGKFDYAASQPHWHFRLH